MAREITYQAIIIKRQPYGEGDEILTVYTRQAGKLRVLAKSVKYSKSKLRSSLQTLFLVNLTTTSAAAFPKVIRVEAVKAFARIGENLAAAERVFYALELVLKFTADEHKNERLFDLMADFLDFLNSAKDGQILNLGLAKFKIAFLESVGLGIHYQETEVPAGDIGFSNVRGGFSFGQQTADARRVAPGILTQFLGLRRASFSQLLDPAFNKELLAVNSKPLQDLLSNFIKYHLERDINSEKYLE
jgi:DNA repair protein RecO